MLEIVGLCNSFISFEDGDFNRPKKSPPYFCEAHTLGEAFEQYCKEYGCTIQAYIADPPLPPYDNGTRMAIVHDDPKTQFRNVVAAVSIERDGRYIDANYGFGFLLQPGDRVHFGVGGC